MQLAECLRVTCDIIRVKAEEARLAFVVDVAPDVPERVIADETRLRQVLLNLLSNAVKFTERGEVVLRVRVMHAGAQRTTLRFDVQDTGVGLREDQLEKIFSPFEQVGDVRRRTVGSGLGLAISRQLVRLMGGDIHVASKPGCGADFSFELELQVVRTVLGGPSAQRRVVGYEGPRKRILIVDDMPANRLVLWDMLRPLGFEIDEAADGKQALERARALTPDLVVMDLEMPVMSGTQAMALMREIASLRGVRIIAVSATENADAVRIGPGLEADAFLAKPLDRESLLREIAVQLGLKWTTADTPVVQPL
jgi:CheY-like chemotaxis protein